MTRRSSRDCSGLDCNTIRMPCSGVLGSMGPISTALPVIDAVGYHARHMAMQHDAFAVIHWLGYAGHWMGIGIDVRGKQRLREKENRHRKHGDEQTCAGATNSGHQVLLYSL